MSEMETAVTQDVDSATTDATSTPDSTSTETSTETSSSAATQAAATGRTYRDEDVQRIVRERLAAADRKYQKQLAEREEKLKTFESHYQRLSEAEYARAKALGLVREEQPKFLTEKDVQSQMAQLRQEIAQQQEQVEQARLYNMAKSQFDQVKAKSEWADAPGYKEAWANAWDPNKDPMAIAAQLDAWYEKKYAERSNKAAAKKEETLKTPPVKGSGGTVSAGAKDGEKVPLRSQLKAALLASRG